MEVQYRRTTFVTAGLTSFLTLLLIGLGSFISSGGYGQAIPDWPLALGELVPPSLVGGILYEYLHRFVALLVGIFTLVLCLLVWKEESGVLRQLALAAVIILLFQIVLGGVGVLTQFGDALRMLHASLSHIFFAVTVALFTMTSPGWLDESGLGSFSEKTVRQSRALTSMILIQVILGAVARHSTVLPVFLTALLTHIVLALGIVFLAIPVSRAIGRESQSRGLKAAAVVVVVTVLLQLLLGILVFVSAPRYDDTGGQREIAYIHQSVTHVTLGALLLGASLYAWLMTGSKRPAVR